MNRVEGAVGGAGGSGGRRRRERWAAQHGGWARNH